MLVSSARTEERRKKGSGIRDPSRFAENGAQNARARE
jgi:hypothetical protein